MRNVPKYLKKGALKRNYVYVGSDGERWLFDGVHFLSGNGQYRTHCDDGARLGSVMPITQVGHVATLANLTEVKA